MTFSIDNPEGGLQQGLNVFEFLYFLIPFLFLLLFYSILFYSILFYSILFYSILFYSTLAITELSIIYIVSEKVYFKSQITVKSIEHN